MGIRSYKLRSLLRIKYSEIEFGNRGIFRIVLGIRVHKFMRGGYSVMGSPHQKINLQSVFMNYNTLQTHQVNWFYRVSNHTPLFELVTDQCIVTFHDFTNLQAHTHPKISKMNHYHYDDYEQLRVHPFIHQEVIPGIRIVRPTILT